MIEELKSVHCPYCREAIEVPGANACRKCGAAFPWSVVAGELRNEMKERETSRLRATATLTNELIGAMAGGPRPTIQAVKGFVNAWLLPRAVLVAGGLLGGLAVALQVAVMIQQTSIMENQTALLIKQSAAADAQAAEIYRVRISKLEATRAALIPLLQHLERDVEPVCFDNTCPQILMTPLVLGSADVVLTFSGIRPSHDQNRQSEACRQPLETDIARASCLLSQMLWRIDQRVDAVVRRSGDLQATQGVAVAAVAVHASGAATPQAASVVPALATAATACAMPVDQKNSLVEVFVLLHGLSAAYGRPLSSPSLQSIASKLGPPGLSNSRRFEYAFAEFISRARSVPQDAARSLRLLMDGCAEKARRDQDTLAKLERVGG